MSTIELSLILPDVPISMAEHVVAECVFKNKRGKPIYFNSRLTVPRDIWFAITYQSNRLSFLYKVTPRPIEASDFQELHPGQAIVMSYVLTNGFELNREGVFRVTAHYENHSTYPRLGKDYEIFVGEVVSSAMKLTLTS